MNLMRDMRPFCKGLHQLSVIATDLAEAESLIKALAEEEQQRTPDAFAGKEPCVYFKLPYTPSCEPFRDLRRLILRIRENTGLRANFHGVVAIEVSEWISHEREEYFTVVLKYLYDHRGCWQMAAVLNGCTANQLNRFLSDCSRYITPRLFEISVFGSRETLCTLIRRECSLRNRTITGEATELLAAALARQELKDARSLTLIGRAVEEVLFLCETGKAATAGSVRDYLINPCSTLTMMARIPLITERTEEDEKEALQLRG